MRKPFSFLPVLSKNNVDSFFIWHIVSSGALALDFKNSGDEYMPGIFAFLGIIPWVYTGKQLFWNDWKWLDDESKNKDEVPR